MNSVLEDSPLQTGPPALPFCGRAVTYSPHFPRQKPQFLRIRREQTGFACRGSKPE
jgi:hypothetical protein